MTRNDIKALFPDAEKSAIDQLLDINSADIGKASSKFQTTQDQLEGQVSSLNEQITSLTSQITSLNGQVKSLTNDIAERDKTIQTITGEKDTALNNLKAQYEVDVKTLTDKQANDLKTLEDQLKAAQEKAGLADTRTERVAQLTQTVADRDATIASNNKTYQIKNELRGHHAKNVDVVWPLLNLEKITVNEDGKLEGFDDQVEALLKNEPYLFDINTGNSRGGVPGSPDVGGTNNSASDVVNKAIRALSGRGN